MSDDTKRPPLDKAVRARLREILREIGPTAISISGAMAGRICSLTASVRPLLDALDAAEARAERAEGERDGTHEALARLTALYESEYDNEPPPSRPKWLQDALGGEAGKVADARDAAHYDAMTREMTRREQAESALAALHAEAEGMRIASLLYAALIAETAPLKSSDTKGVIASHEWWLGLAEGRRVAARFIRSAAEAAAKKEGA